jgi:hypothetical protein
MPTKQRTKSRQYQLITTASGHDDMPHAISGKDRASVLKAVRKRLHKGEKIVSLRLVKPTRRK